MRRVVLLAVIAMLSPACTQSTPERGSLPDLVTTSTGVPTTVDATTSASPDSPSTTEGSMPTTAVANQPPPITAPGRLAIIDLSGEVIVTSSDGQDRRPVTINGFQAFHQQPVWSPDGSRLVFAESTVDGDFVVIVENGLETRRVETESTPFYFQWDPAGEQVGLLRNDEATGFALDVLSAIGTDPAETVDGGAPLFFDWGPDGSSLAVHASETPLRVATVGAESEALSVDNGPYSVPLWTPLGILHVARVPDGLELRLAEPGAGTSTLASTASVTAVVLDPARERIAAYALPLESGTDPTIDNSGLPIIGRSDLVVIDLATREATAIESGDTFAFFWSPDGEKLLYFAVDDQAGPVWKVWDRAGGTITVYPTLRLGTEFAQQIIPFFEQYALSLQLWAPDSSAFAYPAQVEAGSGIFVQSLEGSVPTLVSDGTWVTWSSR